ncbi:MAG: ATP-binding protein [Trueperaceae bacterium]|nr:ATP-binding protein [Trueperaceae bacterium]
MKRRPQPPDATAPRSPATSVEILERLVSGELLEALRPMMIATALFFALVGVAAWVWLEPPARNVTGVLILIDAALILVVYALLRRPWFPTRWVQPSLVLLSLAIAATTAAHMYFMQDPFHTISLAIMILALGSVLLSFVWLAVAVALTTLIWAGVVVAIPASRYSFEFAFAYGLAALVALAIQRVRQRLLLRLEHLREESDAQREQAEARQRKLAASATSHKQSEERFRRLADASFEGIVVHRDGYILDANPRFAQMHGYNVRDLVGSYAPALVTPEATAKPRPDHTVSYGPIEALGKRRDGSTFPVEVISRSVPYQDGKAQVIAVRDVSERKEAERALLNYQHELEHKNAELEHANRLKSAFLATMSHELRTPLTAINGFSELLAEELFGELNDQQKQYVGDIHKAGLHLLELINDILDLSKIEADKMLLRPQPTDLGALVRSVVATVTEEGAAKEIDVRVTVGRGLEPVDLDAVRIKQVLRNYLSNALKFTPSGGRVDVIVSEVPFEVHVEVIDTGVGIAPEDMDKLFKPFSQVDASLSREFEGTGLGLALSKHLVVLHGGEVWAESEQGVGSRFGFSLPRC